MVVGQGLETPIRPFTLKLMVLQNYKVLTFQNGVLLSSNSNSKKNEAALENLIMQLYFLLGKL
jgi:hypothetical protein